MNFFGIFFSYASRTGIFLNEWSGASKYSNFFGKNFYPKLLYIKVSKNYGFFFICFFRYIWQNFREIDRHMGLLYIWGTNLIWKKNYSVHLHSTILIYEYRSTLGQKWEKMCEISHFHNSGKKNLCIIFQKNSQELKVKARFFLNKKKY